ncbi:MAG: hypothetical protein ACREEA_03940, partial [Stellaceae bacterium]
MEKAIRLFPDSRGKQQVTLFRRGVSYYARFRVQNHAIAYGARYLTETMKTLALEEATQRAWERLAAIRVAEKTGIVLKSDSVAEEIDAFISGYEDRLSKGMSDHSPFMLRGFRKTIGRYWRAYIGHKRLADVSLHDMESYEEWRLDYWHRWIEDQKKPK